MIPFPKRHNLFIGVRVLISPPSQSEKQAPLTEGESIYGVGYKMVHRMVKTINTERDTSKNFLNHGGKGEGNLSLGSM